MLPCLPSIVVSSFLFWRLRRTSGCADAETSVCRYDHDAFLPAVSPKSKGVKVLVKPKTASA